MSHPMSFLRSFTKCERVSRIRYGNGGSPGHEEGQVPAAKGTVSDFVHVFFCWEEVHTAFSPDDKEVQTGDSSREQARDGELQEGSVIFVWESSEALALSWYGHFFNTFFNLLNSTYEQPARWLRASFSMYSEYVLPNFMVANLHNLLTPNKDLPLLFTSRNPLL